MEIPEMVLCVLKTLAAGPLSDKRLVAIDWSAWDEAPTAKIHCVFSALSYSEYACTVYSIYGSETKGIDRRTRETWTVDD